MTVQNLSYLFRPTSVAVIGASNRPRSVGSVVMRNLLQGGFAGPIMPINPKYESVQGVLAYRNVESLPRTPDLAVIATPPATVPGLIEALGRRGTRAAIVLTAGLGQKSERDGKTLQQLMLEAARPHRLRILGPNCLGLIVPSVGLNASFSHEPALPGRVAFVSQSGALGTAVLDWARSRGIGFSHFVSLGDMGDIDFGDVIDFLGGDPHTRAILLYIEAIREARKFMSAARGAARNKPLLVIKSGRVAEGAAAAASHTGALAGADDVYDAAFRRAGMLRVFETDELFDAVETLTRARPLRGDRLCILTNGGGPGVMATDALIAGGGRLATLGEETRHQLDAVLPATWSHANPVDIIGDATPERYAAAMRVLARDANLDALLVMHVPTAVSSPTECAQAVVSEAHTTGATILTTWLGGGAVEPARNLFAQAGLPSYETPDQAVRAFMHMVNYRRNQETLMETPVSLPEEFTPDTARAREVIDKVLAEERSLLTEPEAKEVLAAYDVPVVRTRIAADVDQAVAVAAELGFPVAVKILSPDITHKTDVGGVALDLDTREAVVAAAKRMLKRVGELRPEARIEGFSVQNMARRPRAHELIIGATTDSVFGPIMLFGQGGTAVEVIGDRAVALPPLNMNLAKELISRTRVAKLLAGYRDRPAADLDAIRLTLIKVSQLIIDIPEITELDVNPLYADDKGVLALDARVGVRRVAAAQVRLAIRPYPRDLEETGALRNGRQVFVRPIRPEDEPAHRAFIARLTPEDIRFRFFGLVREFAHSQLARFTQIDYDREMAFIATGENEDGHMETLGVVRGIADPDNQRAEFAIVVRSDLKGQGLGRLLLDKMIRYCRRRGNRELVGRVLADNKGMLDLAKRFGFAVQALPEGGILEVSLKLAPEQAGRAREKTVTPLRRPGPR